MTTEKSISIGGLDQACPVVVMPRVASAVRVHSCCPCNFGILTLDTDHSTTHFQTIKLSDGTYFAFPTPTLASAFVVFNGVGILTTMLLALSLASKLAFR